MFSLIAGILIILSLIFVFALPTITVDDPTPANNTYQSQNWSYFNFTSDENLDMAYLYLHNNTATAAGPRNMSNDSQIHWYLNLTLDEYAYNWTVQMVNTSNLTHSTNSSMYYFTIDYTAPTAEFGINPVDNYNSSKTWAVFEVRVNDTYANFLELWANFSGTWEYNQTNSSPTTAVLWYINVSGIADGKYVWGVFGNDSAGNNDFSANRTIYIDTTDPTPKINVPVDNYNSTSVNVTFVLNCTDATSSVQYLELWSNFSGTWAYNQTNNSVHSGVNWNITVNGITDGYYLWGAYCNDSVGNNNYSIENRTLLVDSNASISYGAATEANFSNKTHNWVYMNLSFSDTLNSIINITYLLSYENGSVVNTTILNKTNFGPSNWTLGVNWTSLGEYNYTYNATLGSVNGYKANTSGEGVGRLISLDVTNPLITHSCTPTSVICGEEIDCTCTAADGHDASPTVTYTIHPSTSSIGSYSTSCNVTDYFGNAAQSNVTYTINTPAGGSSGGGGSSTEWTTTFIADDKNLDEKVLITNQLGENHRVRIKIDGEQHYIGILDLTSTTAKIQVSSTPQEATLNLKETKKFDVTDDGYYDLSVTLNSIANNKADLTIKSIVDEKVVEEEKVTTPTEEEVTGEETTPTEKKSLLWLWIVLGVIAAIIVFLVLLFALKPKKRRYR